jgi:hypothetical protein
MQLGRDVLRTILVQHVVVAFLMLIAMVTAPLIALITAQQIRIRFTLEFVAAVYQTPIVMAMAYQIAMMIAQALRTLPAVSVLVLRQALTLMEMVSRTARILAGTTPSKFILAYVAAITLKQIVMVMVCQIALMAAATIQGRTR